MPTFGYMPFMPTRRLLEEIADSAARQALASTMAHLARHYRGGRPSVLEKQWRQDDEDIRRYLSNSGRFRSVSKVSRARLVGIIRRVGYGTDFIRERRESFQTVTPRTIEKLRDRLILETGWKRDYALQTLSDTKALLRYVIRERETNEKLLAHLPEINAKGLYVPDYGESESDHRKPLMPAQIDELIGILDRTVMFSPTPEIEAQYARMVKLEMVAGPRPGELYGLTMESFNESNGVLTYLSNAMLWRSNETLQVPVSKDALAKTGERSIKLNDFGRRVLLEQLEWRRSMGLWTGSKHPLFVLVEEHHDAPTSPTRYDYISPMSHAAYYQWLRRLAAVHAKWHAQRGCVREVFPPYRLRHTAITYAIASNDHDYWWVSRRIAGHASVAMTEEYSRYVSNVEDAMTEDQRRRFTAIWAYDRKSSRLI